jgi:hypothetical protein
MPFNIVLVMIIAVISVSLVAIASPWAIKTINESMDAVEVSFIKSQFETCNDRILETARTGTANKCFFNINRGELAGRPESLNYTIVSTARICDPSPLTEVDEKKHIWQLCYDSGGQSVYEMMWMFPKELEISGSGVQGSKQQGESSSSSIDFDQTIQFETLSVYVNFDYEPGETGNVIDMVRTNVTEDDVTIRIKFT